MARTDYRKLVNEVVTVHWIDTRVKLEGGQTTPIHVLTFGILGDLERKFVRVHSEAYADATFRQTTAIPRKVVLGIYPWPGFKKPKEYIEDEQREKANP